jgi:hypothetical protein
MTITQVKKIAESGQATKDGYTYEEVYQAYFTGGYSTAALLHNTHADLPKVADEKDGDPSSFATTVKPELEDGSWHGEGIARYTVSFAPKGTDEEHKHPMQRRPKIVWGGSGLTETVRKEVDGLPIKNSAGDFYDPLPERPVRGARVTITVNLEENPASICDEFSWSTNGAAWFGVPAGKGMMEEVTAELVSEQFEGETVEYWTVTFPIRFRRDNWKLKLLDNGYRQKDPATGAVTTILDPLGERPAVPVLLNGAGEELPEGEPPVVYPTAGYNLNEATNWGSLPLPNPFA